MSRVGDDGRAPGQIPGHRLAGCETDVGGEAEPENLVRLLAVAVVGVAGVPPPPRGQVVSRPPVVQRRAVREEEAAQGGPAARPNGCSAESPDAGDGAESETRHFRTQRWTYAFPFLYKLKTGEC